VTAGGLVLRLRTALEGFEASPQSGRPIPRPGHPEATVRFHHEGRRAGRAVSYSRVRPRTDNLRRFPTRNPATSTPATVLPSYQLNAIVEVFLDTS
jgi:hypothetical protein